MPLRSDWSSTTCPIAHAADVLDEILVLAVDGAFLDDAWSVRDRAGFERCRETGRPREEPRIPAGQRQALAGLAAPAA